MEDENGTEKTEEPTPKREEDFREEGKIAQSREITSVAVLLGAALGLYALLRQLMAGLVMAIRTVLRELDHDITLAYLIDLTQECLSFIMLPMGAILGVVCLLALLGQIGQVGFNLTTKPLEPKLEKLNPLSGLSRIFSSRGAVELFKGVLKMAIVGLITYHTLKDALVPLLTIARQGVQPTLDLLGDLLWLFTIRTLMVFAALAGLDYLYQRYELMKEMKMTKQEVKDEAKNRDGDQQVKHRMRNMVRNMLAKTGVRDVPKADVVITNPSHFAVALRYEQGKMDAPVVVARGMDRIAERIKDEARRHGIPRVENRALARALYRDSKVGDPIPLELYTAVAEVLAYVYRIKNRRYGASADRSTQAPPAA